MRSGKSIGFDIEPFRKKCLLEGLDDIALTLNKDEKIKSFETKHSSITSLDYLINVY